MDLRTRIGATVGGTAMLVATLWAFYALWRGPASTSGAPNVLIILWDTVRADRLSLYGHDAPTSPRLDALAADAMVFDHAISPGFWTLPAHASLFTGLPVTAHGATFETPWLDDELTTMAEWFGAHGYDTYAWSTNPNVHPIRNLVQGVDAFHSPLGEAENPLRHAVLQATKDRRHPRDASTHVSPLWRPTPRKIPAIAGPIVPGDLTSWLQGRERQDRPFWAFVNLMEAHDPRLPTAESRALMLGERTEDSLALDGTPGRMRRATRGDEPYSERERQILLSVYDATIRDLDASTGELLDALDAAGALDNTIVVLTSDHGELFGEHDQYRHNSSLWEELVHVPLVLHYPAAIPARRVSEPVSTGSVFATLCHLTGLAHPQVEHFDARNLLEAPPEHVVTEALDPLGKDGKNPMPERVLRTQRAIYAGSWKAIWAEDGDHDLFDVQADPTEQTDQLDEAVDRGDTMLGELADWERLIPRRTPDVPANPGMLRADGTYSKKPTNAVKMLQGLGYIEPEPK